MDKFYKVINEISNNVDSNGNFTRVKGISFHKELMTHLEERLETLYKHLHNSLDDNEYEVFKSEGTKRGISEFGGSRFTVTVYSEPNEEEVDITLMGDGKIVRDGDDEYYGCLISADLGSFKFSEENLFSIAIEVQTNGEVKVNDQYIDEGQAMETIDNLIVQLYNKVATRI